MRVVLLVAMAAILAAVSPASASRNHIVCKWCVSKRTYVRFPVCHTEREPIALRHRYLIYLPHEVCH